MHYQGKLALFNLISEIRAVNMINFSVILSIELFIGYITIDFGFNEVFTLKLQKDLFKMLEAFFILSIDLHKNDVFNLK